MLGVSVCDRIQPDLENQASFLQIIQIQAMDWDPPDINQHKEGQLLVQAQLLLLKSLLLTERPCTVLIHWLLCLDGLKR